MKEIKKGKNEFTQKQVEELIFLIRKRCNASKEEQKSIRDEMRKIGFYGRDNFGITNMTVDKFNGLISSGDIIVVDKSNTPSTGAVNAIEEETPVLPNNNKQGLEAWCGDEPYVLILGTLPGDESLRQQAYYQNKSNLFYKIMEHLFERESGASDKDFVLSHHIALWDCMKKAEREGSTDAKIKDGSIVPNEIEQFLILHPTITTICLNGTGKTTDTFNNYFCLEELEKKFRIISLPSTSNLNRGMGFEDKLKAWSVVKEIVESANKKTV